MSKDKEVKRKSRLEKLQAAALMLNSVPKIDKQRDKVNEALERISWSNKSIGSRVDMLETIITKMVDATGFSTDTSTRFLNADYAMDELDDVISELILELEFEAAKINLENTTFDK